MLMKVYSVVQNFFSTDFMSTSEIPCKYFHTLVITVHSGGSGGGGALQRRSAPPQRQILDPQLTDMLW